MAINPNSLQKLANSLRILSADMVERAQSGHPGMPLGMADVIAVLFAHFLQFNPDDPKWPNRDRFIMSAGHGSAILYSLLHLLGYSDCTLDELKNFRQLGAKTAGHPEYGLLSGIEATTGPLGQGIANAVGMAIAEKKIKTRFNFINHKIYAVAGDGCLMEGISHEACSLAGHLQLNNLILFFDSNKISIDGSTSLSNSDDACKRFESYNWEVLETDGHDFEQIHATLIKASHDQQKPTLIICNTIIGKGCETKEGSENSHGAPLGQEELSKLRENLNLSHPPFEIPDEIYQEWKAIGQLSQNLYENWINEQHAALSELDSYLDCNAVANCTNQLQKYKEKILENRPTEATRKSFGKILENFDIVHLIGGSADLSESNCVINNKNTKVITKDDFSGNFIHYGIREHAMTAVMNGLSLYGGMVPFGGTFLVFSDYCRAAIRLSALMKRRVIYVMTHDSIGLGEDGPTHQPIEHLASLRAMPNLLVMRPADEIETVECFSIALQSKEKPVILVLSRQNLPLIREHVHENFSEKGAYILRDSELSETKVVIFATGSEVQIALEAQKVLESEYQIGVRVVSVVSFELFNKQNQEYQDEIFTKNVQIRVAIEAGSIFGWEKFIEMNGIFVGMSDHFGESAPAKDLFQHFGITAENVMQKVLRKMKT